MEVNTVLFDLDGTLTNSGPGIMNSVQYALKRFGMETDDLSKLRCFIGPPLQQQFHDFCGFSEQESVQAVEYYREYYVGKGIYENEVYQGIPELLAELKNAGKKIIMATSKPEKFARIIAEHFKIDQYFDFIAGALMDDKRTKKKEVIEYALDSCGIADKGAVLMIGDRNYDIIGARQAGVHSMAVLYGYGTRQELEEAKPDLMAASPKDVGDCILNK